MGVIFVASACSQSSSGSGGSSESGGGADRTDSKAIEQGGGEGQPGSGGAKASGKVLLVAQSTFKRAANGQYTVPGPATLLVLRQEGSRWHQETIEDPESSVFHKGMVIAEEGQEPAIVTIAGKKAALKLWRRQGKTWTSKTVWQPSFGGENDRLRDIEIADVTGDNQPEIVLATHDQGVVAVMKRTKSGWEPIEIDREPNTFVHEVEVGDVDGDGTAEIYATPSHPNKGTGGPQPGKVTRYQWNGERFEREVVISWDTRHAKEILVADLDGNGHPELYASLEGETEGGLCGMPGSKIVHPGEIVRLDRGENGWSSKVVATLENECLCRFLLAGDLDNDGSPELIAATSKQGIWMFEPGPSLPLKGTLLTRETGGFEHASLLADMDGQGGPELYVADDSHGRLVRYTWSGGRLGPAEVILTRTVPRSAMTWNLWVADYPAAR